jgi:predicted NBD/HSP70 family sugar kinase
MSDRFVPHQPAIHAVCSSNERRLLRLIRDKGPISRADLARETGLTLQSVVRLVAGLMDRNLVGGGPKVASGPGQPSLPIEIIGGAALAVGVSVMDDALAVVMIDLSGAIRIAHEELFDTSDRRRVAEHVADLLPVLADRAAVDRARIFGVGIAIPGFFTGRKGQVNSPLMMNDWALTDIGDQLSRSFGLPVWIENDGSAAAAGESLYGAGKTYRSFAYVHISAGLGGGIVLDGKLWRGAHGNAGEFTGALAPASRADRPTMRLLLELVNESGARFASVGPLVQAFDPAWPAAETWLARSRDCTAAILSGAAAIFDPEAIIVGGRIPVSLARRLIEQTSFYSVPVRNHDRAFPTLHVSSAQSDAAALGAAALPFLHHYF